MKTLIINQEEVAELLPMAACIELMAEAFKACARGEAVNPLRRGLLLPDRSGLLGIMPGYLEGIGMLGVKVVSIFHANQGSDRDSHQGAVLLFEAGRGQLLAVIDSSSITAIRTAAASAVATRLLAREDAEDLALLGSGVQARSHLEAMRLVRPIHRVRVWSGTDTHARRFADALTVRGIDIEVASTAQAAVENADVICTTTAAQEPILSGDWPAPGCHINAVGSSIPSARELDAAAVARSRLFVDSRESALHEAGDFLLAKQEGAVGDDHILGEIGDLLLGRIKGRRSPDEVTLFKSLGIAVQDVAAAHYVYREALRTGAGLRIELGGRRS